MIAKLDVKLDPNAEIYRILKTQPDWWVNVTSIYGVYVEIRKDDIVDIYFEGGRVPLNGNTKKLMVEKTNQ